MNKLTTKVSFRLANEDDLVEILAMIANDQLGKNRERFELPLPVSYVNAYHIINKDSNQELIVVELDNEIVGTFQLSYLQYLTYQGGLRVLVEAVRVKDSHRGKGLGRLIFNYIIDQSKKNGAHMVQLTSNKERADARRFYESLGFEASHEGLKLHL